MKTWKPVPLESLVAQDVLARAEAFDPDDYCYESEVRGLRLRWLALSKRLLWMAAGIEYIEPELLDWIDRIPASSVYYDFGASNGVFALYAAKRKLRVVAIEPDPSNYFLLSWNAFLNRGVEVDISAFNVAVSDRFSADKLYIHKMDLGSHEKIVGAPVAVFGDTFAPQHVHAIQLVHFDRWIEQMGLPRPEYVKIDVDGHEMAAIRGAMESLRGCKEVFIEIDDAKLDEIAGTLRQLGFAMIEKHQVQKYEGLWNCIFAR
ncbi:FkbM family methyltransferase [Variovorax ginsengisoli]|uniref:FkbM family methyltransferase n=1 Tax=Variovorax ginsengisoli TaxID=363844 RepID=A0ABT8SBK5_9BURK|nr:FkbM family methyltransferase [Variovorax ginsengisoli]MDN8616663.1 FkbM family methyltransferase [Variovorax ginsengisoli]MDO1535833.1 FkbM family methyltransferase [Variovorax ginsengisoli]